MPWMRENPDEVPNQRFEGWTVLISAGAKEAGDAVARRFAAEGIKVAVWDRDEALTGSWQHVPSREYLKRTHEFLRARIEGAA